MTQPLRRSPRIKEKNKKQQPLSQQTIQITNNKKRNNVSSDKNVEPKRKRRRFSKQPLQISINKENIESESDSDNLLEQQEEKDEVEQKGNENEENCDENELNLSLENEMNCDEIEIFSDGDIDNYDDSDGDGDNENNNTNYSIDIFDDDETMKGGAWSADETLRLLKSALNHQWFTSGNIQNHVGGIKEDVPNRTAQQIKTKLKWLNKEVPKIRTALQDRKNFVRGNTMTGKPKATFMRTKRYKTSKSDWFLLYEKELGAVTLSATTLINSSKKAQELLDEEKQNEKERRAQKAKLLAAKKNVYGNAMKAITVKSDTITGFLQNIQKKQYNSSTGIVRAALMETVKAIKGFDSPYSIIDDKKLLKQLITKLNSTEAADHEYIEQIAASIKVSPIETRGIYLLNLLHLDDDIDGLGLDLDLELDLDLDI